MYVHACAHCVAKESKYCDLLVCTIALGGAAKFSYHVTLVTNIYVAI